MNTNPEALNSSNKVISKYQIIDLLKTGIYTVTFTKVDGYSKRVMPCTLMPSFLPQKEFKDRQVNAQEETLAAFATDIREWRSFRIANVISVTPT